MRKTCPRKAAKGWTDKNQSEQSEQSEQKPESQAGRGFRRVLIVPTLYSLSRNSRNTSNSSALALRGLAPNLHPPVFLILLTLAPGPVGFASTLWACFGTRDLWRPGWARLAGQKRATARLDLLGSVGAPGGVAGAHPRAGQNPAAASGTSARRVRLQPVLQGGIYAGLPAVSAGPEGFHHVPR